MSSWLLFTIIGGLLANGTTITNRFGLKGAGDATAYGWWFEVVRTLLFVLVLPFDFSFHYSLHNVFTLIILGIVELVAVYFFMKMFVYAELSVSTLITRLRLIWTPLFAALFLGEILTTRQYLGIICIFIGALATTSLKHIKLDPGIKYSFIFALLSGILSIAMKAATPVGSTSLVMIAMGIPAILFLPLLMKQPITRIRQSYQNAFRYILITSIFNIGSMYFYLEGLRLAPVGPVFAIFSSMALLAVFAGIFWLNEKENIPAKIIGACISVAGIFLLT